MPTIVELPRLTDTMREGTLATWVKEVGEGVEAGDALAEIETDKAVMTFESFDEGVLLKTLVQPGEAVPLGTPIAILGEAGEDIEELAARLQVTVSKAIAGLDGGDDPGPETVVEAPRAQMEPREATAAPEPAPAPAPAPSAAPSAATDLSAPSDIDGRRVPASPLARRLARDRGIDLRAVAGSGPRGRIVLRDLEGREAPRQLLGGGALRAGRDASLEDESVRVTQMRRTIAQRLVEAKQTAPHYYLTLTCDCDRLADLRAQLNEAQDQQRVSYNDLVMRACVLALASHPGVNAAWEGRTIRRFGSVHLGFAVAMEEGLITPVIRQAERLDLLSLATSVRELAGRARAGQLDAEEYTGNSFCVSNLGMYGIEHFTAVINPPAACILAVGALREVPVVREGALTVGKQMTLTLSCDHRVVDGAMGAAFLADLRVLLEQPLRLLL